MGDSVSVGPAIDPAIFAVDVAVGGTSVGPALAQQSDSSWSWASVAQTASSVIKGVSGVLQVVAATGGQEAKAVQKAVSKAQQDAATGAVQSWFERNKNVVLAVAALLVVWYAKRG